MALDISFFMYLFFAYLVLLFFMGALIGSIVKNYSLEDAIEIGSAAAAIVVTKVGCSHAMPNMQEIRKFMKNKLIK